MPQPLFARSTHKELHERGEWGAPESGTEGEGRKMERQVGIKKMER